MIIVLLLIMYASISDQSGFKFEQICSRKANQQLQELIERMIEEIKKPIQCIVYIGDFYYREAIKSFELKISQKIPIYQLRIRDSQKLFPPRNRILSILKSSHKNACNLYLILMANGMQLSKLLQFAEENRLIDTRAMFIMMNDYRLLTPNMQYLWNRIINVIFIKRYNVFKRRSGEQVTREWYDLNTIYYPATVKGLVVTKYIDSWYRRRFRYNIDHFPQKTQNLRGKRLRVAVFQHIPAVTEIAVKYFKTPFKKTSHALGLEFELMRIIAESINFRAIFYEPNNISVEKWGRIGENETTGLLGEAVDRKAAFYLGDLHYTSRHLNIVDLAWPYNIECLTFLTPESLTENSWKLLIQPFDLYSWILVLLTLIIGGIVIFLVSIFYERSMIFWKIGNNDIEETKKLIRTVDSKSKKRNELREKFKDETEGLYLFSELTNSMLYTYSMLLQVSLPMLPRVFAVRILIGWWWIYTILITCSYRASLTAALANPTLRVTIDTIEELSNSPIGVGSWGEEKKDYFLSSGDENLQKIGSRFEEITDENKVIDRVAKGRFSYYENIFVLQQVRVKRQILEYDLKRNAARENSGNFAAERNLHVMEECVVNMPVSIGLDKNSPLKPCVDELLKRAIEVGLVQKWLKDAMEWSKIVEMRQENEAEKATANLRKLQGALVVLAVGYSLGFLALFAEILHWKYIVTRNPLFDKYHLDLFYKDKF